MKRRSFLKKSAVGALAVSSGLGSDPKVYAQFRRRKEERTGPKPILVVLFFRGGQDQLNTFVPYADPTYYKIRPSTAIAKDEVIKLNEYWGLHPVMAPLKPFWDEGRFAAVINSGSPHPTRSHFDAQDFMEYAAPGDRTISDGWLNRYLQATAKEGEEESNIIRAVAMQELLPRSLRGRKPVVAVPSNLYEMDEVLDLFEDFYGKGGIVASGEDPFAAFKKRSELKTPSRAQKGNMMRPRIEDDPVMASGAQTIKGLRRLREILYGTATQVDENPEIRNAAFQEYPIQKYGSRLKAIAKLIKADVGLEIAATDINGWDHHIGMGSLEGGLALKLTAVAEGLAAFMKDLGPHLDRTMILGCTEFGRVCKENGNDGTDHGHGGAMWLLGGPSNFLGGKIYGEWAGLTPDVLHGKARDLPSSTDFREVFAEVLKKHMQFDIPEGFFPKYTPSKEGLGLFA